ncbi:hypothetical protein ACWXWU_03745 [Shewanella sp. A14]
MTQPKHDLDSLLDTLPSEMVPQKDLWVTIKPQLTSQPINATPSKWPVWAIAASLVVCSTLSLSFFYANNPLLVQTTDIPLETDQNLTQLIDQIDHTHQIQLSGFSRNQYTVSWQSNTHNNKQIQNDISTALTELDNASAQVKAALKQQPTNQQLWQLWRWIMQRQITLLQQGQRIPSIQIGPSQGNTL